MKGFPENLEDLSAGEVIELLKHFPRFEGTFHFIDGLALECDEDYSILVWPRELRQAFPDFLVLLKEHFGKSIKIIFDLIGLDSGRLMLKYRIYNSMSPYTELLYFLENVWFDYIQYRRGWSYMKFFDIDFFRQHFQELADGIKKIEGSKLLEP